MLHTTLRLSAAVAAILSLSLSAFAQNDECTGAIPVVNGANQNLSNVGMTTSQGIPGGCGAIGTDAWYSYVATCTGNLTVSTCGGANHDTVLQVLGGSCAALVDLGCNDDSCGLQSSVTVGVTQGSTYYIRVGSFAAGAGGVFTLTLTCGGGGGLGNDNCAGATPVTIGVNGPFSTVGATTSPPFWPCAAGGNDIWFSYAARFTGVHTFSTCSAARTYDTAIEVFSGSCGALVSLACNDDVCGLGAEVQPTLTANNTYYIRVGGYASQTGSFELTVSLGNGQGSIALSTVAACGPTSIGFTGTPTLGGSVTANLGNIVGSPFVGLGFTNPGILFCSCNFGTDWSNVFFGSSFTLNVPANPVHLNTQIYIQGVDFFGTGGCANPQLSLSDAYLITIG